MRKKEKITPAELAEYLGVLNDAGVKHFDCPFFQVNFADKPKTLAEEEMTKEEQEKQQIINETWSS